MQSKATNVRNITGDMSMGLDFASTAMGAFYPLGLIAGAGVNIAGDWYASHQKQAGQHAAQVVNSAMELQK